MISGISNFRKLEINLDPVSNLTLQIQCISWIPRVYTTHGPKSSNIDTIDYHPHVSGFFLLMTQGDRIAYKGLSPAAEVTVTCWPIIDFEIGPFCRSWYSSKR